MFKHIFPNGLGTIVTSVALIIPSMIYSETNLSYLGIINLEAGNTTSVGTLIAAGQKGIVSNAAYVAFFPCFFLVLLMLSFNLFGNGLRDAFNPSLRGSEE
jgi:oligopeptide transport system permease protein